MPDKTPVTKHDLWKKGNGYHEARAAADLLIAEAEKTGLPPDAERMAAVNAQLDDADAIDQLRGLSERADSGIQQMSVVSDPVPPMDIQTADRANGDREIAATTFEDREFVSDEKRCTREYNQAFSRWIETGGAEQRDTLQVDLDTGGGLISGSEKFINDLLINVRDKNVILSLATVMPGKIDESLGQPGISSTLSEITMGGGELKTSIEDTGIAFNNRQLKPKRIDKKHVLVSEELIASSRIAIEPRINAEFANAVSQGLETLFMTGNGAEETLGLFTASDNGISTSEDVSTGNTNTTLTATGLINCQDDLNDIYDGNARWLFKKSTVTKIRLLKNGNSDFIFQPGLQLGVPNQLLGKPVTTGDKVPATFTSGLYVGMYGDFRNYWIADAFSGMQLQRLIEKFALEGQIGFLMKNTGVDAMPWIGEAFRRVTLT